MRRSEILKLRKENVNLTWGKVTLRQTKSGNPRQIPIHPALTPILEAAIKKSPSEWVFTGRTGRPLNIRKRFEAAKKAAGLPGLWFHDLRKAFVTYARGAGHPDKTVAVIAGHKDMRVSDLYTIPTEGQMRAAVESIPAPTQRIHSTVRKRKNREIRKSL